MELHFLGAATTVTGSQYLLVTERARILVDCGMFQGGPNEGVRNRVPLAYDPSKLDAILLTHAHLDHCGLIPLVVAEGFRGPIYATAGTCELAELVLLDSGKLQEESARREERWIARHPERATREAEDERREYEQAVEQLAGLDGPVAPDHEALIRSAGPVLKVNLLEPLYTEAQARAALPLFRAVRYDEEVEVAPGIRARFVDAGHILGSAIIQVAVEEGGGRSAGAESGDGSRGGRSGGGKPPTRIVFSGDLGRPGKPIIRDPTIVTEADYLLVESTYGGREHEPEKEALDALAQVVRLVDESDGVLLVPSFAIGRTQEVVFALHRLIDEGRIPLLPLYLDSPMASKATEIYRRHVEYFDDEARALLAEGESPIDYPRQIVTRDAQQSAKIARARRPYMIVASNGMLTGGRVVGHLKDLIDDPDAVLLFVGYQGEGTLGAHLQAGATTVRIDGLVRQVRCQVRSISGFSAHADESELLAWLASFTEGKAPGTDGWPKQVFIVHGDPEAQQALEPKIRALGLSTTIPRWHQSIVLE